MPRFLGLFSKKSKNTDAAATSSSGASDDLSSVSISPTVSGFGALEKVFPQSPPKSTLHPDSARSIHAPSTPAQGDQSSVYPNSPSAASIASSSKLRLPFSRKRHSPAVNSTTSVNTTESQSVRDFNSAGPRPFLPDRERNSVASDGELTDMRRLKPPPSKSAIFAAYADPQSALSTRSLPNEGSLPFSLPDSGTPSSLSDTSPQPSNVPVPVSAPKRSFFSWTKSTSPAPLAKTKSKLSSSSKPPVQDSKATTSVDLSNSSFNLKSFRHVGPSSPPDSQAQGPCLAVPSTTPLSRPRGPSVGESSQRISVAAFREAQARRSMAGSPVPSFRSPSPFGTQEPGAASSRTSLRSGLVKSSIGHGQQQWNNRGGLTSDSDADTSTEEEESDDDRDRERTVTQRGVWSGKGKVRAKSEAGHGSSKSENVETRPDIPPRPQSSLAQNGSRQRASMSTSALTPSAAAKRASILVNTNDFSAEYKHTSRHVRDASIYSNPGTITRSNFSANPAHRPVSSSDESDEEDDDAPLATLVPPRRPGSALSTASGSSLRGSQSSAANRNRSNSNVAPVRGKPLIDINQLMAGKVPSLPTREGRKEELVEEKGFTRGNTLLSVSVSANTSSSISTGTKPVVASFLSSSPPNSPTESITSSGFVTAPPSIRATPFGQSSPTISNSEPRRDGLGDRLQRVAKGASSTTVNLATPSPFSSPFGSPDANSSSNTDGTKRLSFPRSLSLFDTPISIGSAPPASRRSTDLMNPTNSKFGGVNQLKLSPPDEELAEILGASVRLISKTGESSPEGPVTRESTESEEESEEDVSSDDDSQGATGKDTKTSEKGTDEWEKVDPREVKEYKGKEGLLKGKNVLGLGREKNRGKEVHARELAPKVAEPPIAPIPIKQRAPTPSFSVTSRPPLVRSGIGSGSASMAPSTASSASSSSSSGNTRQRSSTPLNSVTLDLVSSTGGSANEARGRGTALSPPVLRSQDLPSNAAPTRPSIGDSLSSVPGGRQRGNMMPARPFARRESPASSTGDSSSGRAPLTPRDGSDIGSGSMQPKSTESSGSAMKGSVGVKNGKRRSVCFEDDLKGDALPPSLPGKGKAMYRDGVDEEKRRERRRSEAKAAIELGNVINGRGPPVVDDEGEDMPINQSMQARMTGMNTMMGMGSGVHPTQMGSMPSWNGNWGNPMGQQQMVNGSQFMFPQAPGDPGLFAAHQHAMMIAKQAYQMAVAQQAVVAAGDEWERGSVVSGFGGGSMFGGGMPSGPMAPPYGTRLGGMGMNVNMNMMGMGSNWSSAGSAIFPPSSRSMYGGMNATRSEYGGGGGGGGWSSSRSTYGESFGPPTGRVPRPGMPDRDWRESSHPPPVPPIPLHAQANSAGRTSAAPRTRTTSHPASPRFTGTGQRKAPPPSSWKGS